MKRKLLPLLIAGLTTGSAGVVLADNIPTVYGKVNVTLNKYDFDRRLNATDTYTAQDNWQLESNSSRIGVKGDYPIAGDLKVVYKLEYEAFVDGSSSSTSATKYNTFAQRNTYAGLQAGWGTIFAGKNDTPLKAIAADTVQLFKDLPLADFKYFLVGEDRENNIVQYTTPTFSGFNFSAQIEPGEDAGGDSAGTTNRSNDGLVDKYSVAATYKLNTLYLALADTHNIANTNIVRAVGQYGIGPVTIGALWQKADRTYKDSTLKAAPFTVTPMYLATPSSLPVSQSGASNGNPITEFTGSYEEQDAWVVSAAWKINAFTIKGQYGQSNSSTDNIVNLKDTKAKNLVLGVDYKLNDNSKVFAYYASLEADGDNARLDDTIKDKTFAVGYDFKF